MLSNYLVLSKHNKCILFSLIWIKMDFFIRTICLFHQIQEYLMGLYLQNPIHWLSISVRCVYNVILYGFCNKEIVQCVQTLLLKKIFNRETSQTYICGLYLFKECKWRKCCTIYSQIVLSSHIKTFCTIYSQRGEGVHLHLHLHGFCSKRPFLHLLVFLGFLFGGILFNLICLIHLL